MVVALVLVVVVAVARVVVLVDVLIVAVATIVTPNKIQNTKVVISVSLARL